MKRIFAGLLALVAFTAWADVLPITPATAGTTTITVTNSSVATALPAFTASGMQTQVELQNAGSAAIFVEFCTTSTCTAAVASGYPILVGQSKVVTIAPDITTIACISGTTGQTFYVTIGRGN